MGPIDAARDVLREAISSRVFPAAVADVGSAAGSRWREAFGTLTFQADSPAADAATPFDLASLTKVLATTTVVMEQVRSGLLDLSEPIAAIFSEWRGDERTAVTIHDLLEHSSGLPARLLDAPPAGRREFEHDICTMPLEYRPRTRSVYSDLGFILLGFVTVDRARGLSLANSFDAFYRRLVAADASLAGQPLAFALDAAVRLRTAPTLPDDYDARRGRTLIGEVHDNYAAALGGVAGHAGMFGTAGAVAGLARAYLRALRGEGAVVEPIAPPLVQRFLAKSTVPGSSRALGWDTMLTTSSCGERMSNTAFGHVGYTGTSLWIDPDRNRYFVLLTNRACGGGTLDRMRVVRRSFHDALADF